MSNAGCSKAQGIKNVPKLIKGEGSPFMRKTEEIKWQEQDFKLVTQSTRELERFNIPNHIIFLVIIEMFS